MIECKISENYVTFFTKYHIKFTKNNVDDIKIYNQLMIVFRKLEDSKIDLDFISRRELQLILQSKLSEQTKKCLIENLGLEGYLPRTNHQNNQQVDVHCCSSNKCSIS